MLWRMKKHAKWWTPVVLVTVALFPGACGDGGGPDLDQALVLSMAALGENADGSPNPLPARLGILTREGGAWRYRFIEDPDSNVFHKAMAYRSSLLTLGGTRAVVKLWGADGSLDTLWDVDFGGKFSRIRDAEIGDIYGDGSQAIVVATHDQGVVAVLRPDGEGGFSVEELDRTPETVVHEIELGDLNGDGILEIYATPTAPNKVDGTPQPGKVARYVPASGEGRVDVVDLGDRHAKEILVDDLDGDGRDELYVSVEAISGGKVEIRRYDHDTDPTAANIVATLDDKLCRFLTVGDVDGDGKKEMVAATYKAGLWLLRPREGMWKKELIDADSSGFEHASILLDLDEDGRDELYVASDDQGELRRYVLSDDGWQRETLWTFEDDLSRFTWNIMSVPLGNLPPSSNTASSATETTEDIADEPPRGLLIKEPSVSAGYVLFSPLLSGVTYLIDNDGQVVHTWESDYAPGVSVYLLDNGHLLRAGREPEVPVFSIGGHGGRIQEFTWDGELVWDFKLANEQRLMHHDIEPLPNGNVLAIAWERKSPAEVLRVGRRPDAIPEAGLWPDMLLELEPVRPDGARIVWEWHAWDHLVQDHDSNLDGYGDPSEHPELINLHGDGERTEFPAEELERLKALGYMAADTSSQDLLSDYLHTNSIAYNAALDQIALSTPRFHEIWILDHSTTTEEAAGHSGGRFSKGGDLLYRWGNPKTYGRGDESARQLFGQHDVRWIPESWPGGGHLLVFNNDPSSPEGNYSAVVEIAPPIDSEGRYVFPASGPWGPAEPTWTYEAPDKTSFYSDFISGAHRLANGNTMICSGAQGRFMEVTPAGKIVWEYWSPYSGNVRNPDGSHPHFVAGNSYAVFRATKYAPDAAALAGRDLQPLDPQPAPVAAEP